MDANETTEHPVAFLVMFGSTAAMTFHGLVFREQLCMIACPYGRFQSVMLDRKSLIVAYDTKRGEPRKKGKRIKEGVATLNVSSAGDCIDCGRCTAVCPTGIDIRNGHTTRMCPLCAVRGRVQHRYAKSWITNWIDSLHESRRSRG